MDNPQQIPELVDAESVCETFKFSLQTARRLWRAGRFPQPLRLGRRRLFWLVSDLNAFIAQAKEAAEPIESAEKEEIA